MHRATVMIELKQLENDALSAGGVFVPDCVLRLGEECDVVVRGANYQIWLPARAVYVDDRGGAGLELIGFSSEVKAQLAELDLVGASAPPRVVDIALEALADADAEDRAVEDQDDLAIPIAAFEARLDDAGAIGAADEIADLAEDLNDIEAMDLAGDLNDVEVMDLAEDPVNRDDVDAYAAVEDAVRVADRIDDDPGEPSTAGRVTRTMHDRLRGLNLAAQIKLAASGELHERILLERLYGKNVWETLLRNPRLTAPEVSRIARYGALPRVLLDVILANNAWLQVAEVRRALLTNPRLATDQIMKVLRLTPKHELKLAAVQTAYPQGVRAAARMILRDG